MSKIYFRFRAAKDYDTVLFDGVSMSAFDLKREIMISKRLGPGNNIELKIYDAQTEEEFLHDHDQIPRNASIIVKKVPASDFKNASRYLEASNAPIGSIATREMSAPMLAKTTVSSTAPIAASAEPAKPVISETIAGSTEEERIKAMFETSSEQWQQQSTALAMSQSQKGFAYRPQYRPPAPPSNSSTAGAAPAAPSAVPSIPVRQAGGSSAIPIRPAGGSGPQQQSSYFNAQQSRPPPISYVCYKCGIGGHWIHQCPTGSASGGVRPENVVVKKKTTGIPRAFLQVIGKESENADIDQSQLKGVGNLMVTPEGELVIARVNDQMFLQEKSTSLLSLEELQLKAYEMETAGIVAPGTFLKQDLLCNICGRFCHDAVSTACCKAAYCDECIRVNLQTQLSSSPNTKCPYCQKYTNIEQIQIDKPKRALIGQAMRLIMEELKKQTAGSQPEQPRTTTVGGTVISGSITSFDMSKKMSIQIVDTTEERIIRRKFDDRGWEQVYDVLLHEYVSVKEFDLHLKFPHLHQHHNSYKPQQYQFDTASVEDRSDYEYRSSSRHDYYREDQRHHRSSRRYERSRSPGRSSTSRRRSRSPSRDRRYRNERRNRSRSRSRSNHRSGQTSRSSSRQEIRDDGRDIKPTGRDVGFDFSRLSRVGGEERRRSRSRHRSRSRDRSRDRKRHRYEDERHRSSRDYHGSSRKR